jgi:hypothetical protein
VRIKTLHGVPGMMAILLAFRDAPDQTVVEIRVALPDDVQREVPAGCTIPEGYHLLMRVGALWAALTAAEARWLAATLVGPPGMRDQAESEMTRLGRAMLRALEHVPGPHGLH